MLHYTFAKIHAIICIIDEAAIALRQIEHNYAVTAPVTNQSIHNTTATQSVPHIVIAVFSLDGKRRPSGSFIPSHHPPTNIDCHAIVPRAKEQHPISINSALWLCPTTTWCLVVVVVHATASTFPKFQFEFRSMSDQIRSGRVCLG